MADINYRYRMDAEGNLNNRIKAVNRNMKQFRKQLLGSRDAAKSARKSADAYQKSLDGLSRRAKQVGGALLVMFGARAIGGALKQGRLLADVREQAEGLYNAVGATVDEALPRLRKASGGLLTDFELLQGAASGLSLGLLPQDIETITKASRALSAQRGLSQAEAYNQLVTTATRRTLALVDNIGLAPDRFKAATSEAERLALIMGQIEKLANKTPTETAVSRWEKTVTAIKNLRDRMAEAVATSPEFNRLIDKLNDFMTPERVDRWVRAVNNALANLTLRGLFENIEVEVARFIRTPTGRFVALALGVAAGGAIGTKFGGAKGGILGGLAGGAGSFYMIIEHDPIVEKLRKLQDRAKREGRIKPETLDFGPKMTQALIDAAPDYAPELEQVLRDYQKYRRIKDSGIRQLPSGRYILPPVTVTGVRPYKPPREVSEPYRGTYLPFPPHLSAMGYRGGYAGGPLPMSYRSELGGLDRLAGMGFQGQAGLERLNALREKTEKAANNANEKLQLAADAATIVASSLARLDLSSKTLGQGFSSLFASVGQAKIAQAISGGAPGKFLSTLGAGLGFLGVGTLLGAIFGGHEQEKQTRYLEAIARNTDRSNTLLQKIIGAPSGFVLPKLGRPNYDALGAEAALDLGR